MVNALNALQDFVEEEVNTYPPIHLDPYIKPIITNMAIANLIYAITQVQEDTLSVQHAVANAIQSYNLLHNTNWG